MFVGHYDILELGNKVAAVITQDSTRIFDSEDVKPQPIKTKFRGMIPWGEENNQPELILEKIRKSDVMSPNMLFNILVGYGSGFNYHCEDGSVIEDKDIKTFFRRNNMTKFLLEQITDQKHFMFSVCLLILTNDGKKIARIKHKEAYHLRFEENNKATGKIEHVFFGNWKDSPKEKDIQAYPVLDQSDPAYDLLVRMGREPDPKTGKKQPQAKEKIFAVITHV